MGTMMLSDLTVNCKDLGHFWLGYIRMLGHLQMSAHLVNFNRLYNCSHLSDLLDLKSHIY